MPAYAICKVIIQEIVQLCLNKAFFSYNFFGIKKGSLMVVSQISILPNVPTAIILRWVNSSLVCPNDNYLQQWIIRGINSTANLFKLIS